MMKKESGINLWPELFTGKETVDEIAKNAIGELEAKLAVLAAVHLAWGMCYSGMYHIPAKFGEGMAQASEFLGMSVLPSPELNEFSDRLLAEHKVKYSKQT